MRCTPPIRQSALKKKIGGFFGRAGHAARARGPSRAPSARTPRPERAQPGVRRRPRVSGCPPKHPPRARAACGLSAPSQEARARPTAAGGKPFAKKKKSRGKRFRMSRAAHARFAATPLRSKTEEEALPWGGNSMRSSAPTPLVAGTTRSLHASARAVQHRAQTHTQLPPALRQQPNSGGCGTASSHSDRTQRSPPSPQICCAHNACSCMPLYVPAVRSSRCSWSSA